ncbi:MAG: hypothetical protein HYU43_09065, partial [Armatimonadetes bacterium]|nr:hypothetical protein [Armatimonadota bacterium]
MDKTTYPWRGLFVGAGLCAALAAIEPHVKMRLHTNGLCTDYINAGAVLFLFLLALALGPLRALTGRKWLDVPDLAVVFAMLAVACTIPSHGLLAPLLTLVTGASYYATPHNHFEEWILQRLPDWLLVRGEAARFFYEKLPPSEPFPVSAWIQPAIAWTILIAAVFLAQISLAALFYEPWARHERLAFPLVRLPAEMVRSAEDRGSRRPGHLLRDPIFWAGVALTFFIAGSRGLAFYHPETPTLPKISSWLAFFNGTTRILVTFSFVIVGFSYLLNTRVLLSIWFFHLLMKVVSGALILHGVALEGENEPWGGSTLLATHLNGGSMIALVLFGVWTAREHLARVLRDAWRGGH